MMLVFYPPVNENRLFPAVLDMLKEKPCVLSCGFSTVVDRAISIIVFTTGNFEKSEIEKIRLFLNTILANEDNVKDWCEFTVEETNVGDCIMQYQFICSGGKTTFHQSILYFLK